MIVTVRSGHHCSHVRYYGSPQSVDLGSRKVQTLNQLQGKCMRAKMFYYAVETRFSNQSFLPSMSCSVYKANDDRIYFKCFPLVLAGVWLLLMNWARS